jgi:Zn-dependent protease with chaperone function
MGRAVAAMIAWVVISLGTGTGALADGLEISPDEVTYESRRLARAGLELFVARRQRIAQVATRVRLHGVGLCADQISPVTGILATTWAELPMAFREAAYDAYGVDDLVRVLAVQPGSPAAAAGVRPGDTVLSVDGAETHTSADLESTGSAEAAQRVLRIERDGVLRDASIRVEPGCSHPPTLFMLDSLDAYADGGRIAISSGMLRFLESDDELAVILGHELAHALLGHDGPGLHPEAEADRLGLELAARAGYDVAVAADLIRRLGRESPDSLETLPGTTDPDTARRAAALEAEAAEILEQQRRGSLPGGAEHP